MLTLSIKHMPSSMTIFGFVLFLEWQLHDLTNDAGMSRPCKRGGTSIWQSKASWMSKWESVRVSSKAKMPCNSRKHMSWPNCGKAKKLLRKAAAEQERLHQQSMYNEMLNENRSHFPLICWHHSNIPTQVFFFVAVFHILLSFLSKSAVQMKICLCITITGLTGNDNLRIVGS